MKEGPDIALIGALIGDPARANMLTLLMSGRAHTASELAAEAGVAAQTASGHLAKLREAGLLTLRQQGRHRYFTLADEDVAHVLEAIMGLAARRGHGRARTGPRDPAMRKARVCYDHLAGDMGVRIYDCLSERGMLAGEKLTLAGIAFLTEFGVDLPALTARRRPLCRSCLDWSERRTHLAGALGAACLERIYELKWAKRLTDSRAVIFTTQGEKAFNTMFFLPQAPIGNL
ncbi:MAG: ArsR/SmtB family transcription factor [Pikeienuella sp.]